MNAANEITAITGSGAAQPVYDAAGNLTGDGTLRYVYDAWNRQVAVRRASDDAPVAAYQFDGLNRRVQKTVFDPGGTKVGRNKGVRNRFRTMSGPAPTLSHGSDATYDRVEYTYDRAATVVAAKDQGDGNGYAASGVKNKAIPSCQY